MTRDSFHANAPLDGDEDLDARPLEVRIIVYRSIAKGILEYTTDGLSWSGGGFDAEVSRLRRNLHHACDGLVDKIVREGWTAKDARIDGDAESTA